MGVKRTDGRFCTAFGSQLSLVYHSFDRIVILGHLLLLTRPENILHFLSDVHVSARFTKEVVRQRTIEYKQWVEAFARNHHIPIECGPKKASARKTTCGPACGRWSGASAPASTPSSRAWRLAATSAWQCRSIPPTADPDYRILSRQRSRYTYYYFYVRDPVLGPIELCVGAFLPFSITHYNGHHFIEQQLRSAGDRVPQKR
jgi:hypothetical protein